MPQSQLPPWLNPLRLILLRYRAHLPAAALLGGFVWDLLTLGRPDQVYGNIILVSYVLIAGGTIALLNMRKARGREEPQLRPLLLLQFSFGNLASGLFVFYGQSGTLVGNWLFLLVLAALLIGNEFFKDRYGRMYFHVSVYYTLIFAYAALLVPVLLSQIGPRMFFISALVSLIYISLYLLFLWVIAPKLVRENLRRLSLMLGIIFWIFVGLYVGNFIPPVPLSLTEIGIYHSIVKNDAGEYLVSYEPRPWYLLWRPVDALFHATPGERAYCFSSVYAPSGLSTNVFHRLEHYDEAKEVWQTRARVSFPLSGGRTRGFRGYSFAESLTPGKWRCSVETTSGALIGRRTFTVVAASAPVPLVAEVR